MKESNFLIALRKRFKTPLVASVFVLSVMNLTSCENDKPEISSPAAPNITATDLSPQNAAGLKVATIGNSGGSVATAVKNEGLEMYSTDMSNTDFLTSTGTLLIDIDNLNAIEREEMNEFMEDAGKKVKLIVFESGTRNEEKFKNFLNVQFGISERTGDLSAVMVHYKANGMGITPIGKKFNNDAKFVVDEFLSNPKSDVLYKQMKDAKQPLGFKVQSSNKNSTFNQVPQPNEENYYENKSINSCIQEAKNTIAGGYVHSTSEIKWLADPTIHSLNFTLTNAVIIYGPGVYGNAAIHDASGRCRGEQTANMSNGTAIQKQYSINTSLAEKTPIKALTLLSEIAGGIGFQVASAYQTTTVNGTGLNMMRQYATPYIYQATADYDGRFIGEVTFSVVIKKEGQIRNGRNFKFKIKYTADQVNNNKFSGIRPKYDTSPVYVWYVWGNQLPACQ